ncbi:MAG: hypothetical protein K5859_07205 [Atopobiaceae bacterium]|nr:hypothetical protein [Atopobiaceae bacterium]
MTADHPHEHGHHEHHHDEPIGPEEAVRSLLLLGQTALDAGDYESAVIAYESVLKIGQDETALVNLGSLYARGLGARRSFVEAARLFHQAELLGNARAGKLCGKCMYDFIHEGFEDKKPSDLYAAMAVFVSRVYPEAEDPHQEVDHGLFAIAATHYNNGEFAEAAKVFRAGAEFAGDGLAQYYLAMLYDAGSGVEQSDLAALYWLDRAVDSGSADMALEYRDGMLDAYRQSLPEGEFRQVIERLAAWCERGTADIPSDPVKAQRWREIS